MKALEGIFILGEPVSKDEIEIKVKKLRNAKTVIKNQTTEENKNE